MSHFWSNFFSNCLFALVALGAYWMFKGPEFGDLMLCSGNNLLPWVELRCEYLSYVYFPDPSPTKSLMD